MRFASLGSGSRGNGTLVEADGTCLLVDCGFSVRETERRLAVLGKEPAEVRAILVTHEHGDHVRGVAPLARKHDIEVWMTAGTWGRCHGEFAVPVQMFSCHGSFAIDGLEVRPFPVPHDAGEPAQFVFSEGSRRLGILTDTGRITPHVVAMLDRCDALVLECNHDTGLLQSSRYPPALRQRIGGDLGHLSNEQATGLLARVEQGALQHVVAAHLSEENNTPAHARAALCGVLGCAPGEIEVADQRTGLGWRELSV